jgi:hypothetical protein
MEEDLKETKRDSIFSAGKGDERRALNKIDIVSIRILERWDETINVMQLLKENLTENTSKVDKLTSKMKANLYALFLMNDNLFKRRLKPNIYDEVKLKVCGSETKNYEDLEKAFFIMNTTFDEMGLIKVDLDFIKKTLETINKEKGFD